jgi:hypothetical protein
MSTAMVALGQLSSPELNEDIIGCIPGGLAPPKLPNRFTATVEVTAHLVDRTKEYPPWLRVIDVAYDYNSKKVKAVVEQGYNEGKTFLRRYDNRSEFMVRGGQYSECQRAYLGETMPLPQLPASLVFVDSKDVIDGASCDHWVDDLGTNRVHVWACPAIDSGGGDNGESKSSGLLWPRRVLDEQVEPSGTSVPLMTYDLTKLRVNAAAAPRLDTPGTFDIPPPYGWRSCARNIGGFPYLHVFHHFLRF